MKNLIKAGALLAAIVGFGAFGAQERAAAADTGGAIEIVGYEYVGTGCPKGSVEDGAIVKQGNTQTLPLTFHEYTLNITKNDQNISKNCKVTLYLKSPPGQRYALNTITYYGRPDLDPGVIARFEATYYWAGRQLLASSKTPKVLTGPATTAFAFVDTASALTWSDCETEDELTLDTRLALTNARSPVGGEVSIERTEAKVDGSVYLQFLVDPSKCPANR